MVRTSGFVRKVRMGIKRVHIFEDVNVQNTFGKYFRTKTDVQTTICIVSYQADEQSNTKMPKSKALNKPRQNPVKRILSTVTLGIAKQQADINLIKSMRCCSYCEVVKHVAFSAVFSQIYTKHFLCLC